MAQSSVRGACGLVLGVNPEMVQRSHDGLSDEVLENAVLSNFNSPGVATRASYLRDFSRIQVG